MIRIAAVFAGAAAMVISGLGQVGPARAAPPTVVPSPGYDARLQEQRARMAPPPAIVAPMPLRGPRKRAHRHHD